MADFAHLRTVRGSSRLEDISDSLDQASMDLSMLDSWRLAAAASMVEAARALVRQEAERHPLYADDGMIVEGGDDGSD